MAQRRWGAAAAAATAAKLKVEGGNRKLAKRNEREQRVARLTCKCSRNRLLCCQTLGWRRDELGRAGPARSTCCTPAGQAAGRLAGWLARWPAGRARRSAIGRSRCIC